MVTIRWTESMNMPEEHVREVAAEHGIATPFRAACREWVAANPPTPRLADLPPGSIVRWERRPGFVYVKQPNGSWVDIDGRYAWEAIGGAHWHIVHVAERVQ
jgi:hypothetical protein